MDAAGGRGLFAILGASFLGALAAGAIMLWWEGALPSLSLTTDPFRSCNVLKVPVHGSIVTVRSDPRSSEESAENPSLSTDTTSAVSTEIEEMLRVAREDPSIQAVFVDIDSGGGGPVAGFEIASAIARFGKPSVAVIRETGASSGYLVATAADKIFASKVSVVGSIGVTSSFIDYAEQNRKEGLTYNQLSSGPFKDAGSPEKPLTLAERELFMRDLERSHDIFVGAVAENRDLPIEEVAALADGSTMLGEAALEAGLIDEIGGTEEALRYLEGTIGEPASLCW